MSAPESGATALDERYELVWAAHTGDQDKVANLIETSKRGVDDADEDGSTPLIAAAWSNYPEIITLLLNKGAQVNTQNATHGWTALHAAAAKGHVECVRLLLEGVTVDGALVRANPAIEDLHHHTPFVYATHHGHAKAAELIAARLAEIEQQPAEVPNVDKDGVRVCGNACVIM